MPSPIEQIKTLDAIEKEIVSCISSAGNCLQELSKEKPSQKSAEVKIYFDFKFFQIDFLNIIVQLF